MSNFITHHLSELVTSGKLKHGMVSPKDTDYPNILEGSAHKKSDVRVVKKSSKPSGKKASDSA